MNFLKVQEISEEIKSISVKFDVWRRFYPPYRCICCGKEISLMQFRFSCLCGYCDLGKCKDRRIGMTGLWERGHHLELWKKAEINTKLNI